MKRPQLCGGIFPERPRKKRTRPCPEKKTGIFEMTFTGTLIEDLMATVERVEKRARADRARVADASALEALALEPRLVEPAVVQPWLTSVQENADYDSKFLGVA
jgi:hypothetical protein